MLELVVIYQYYFNSFGAHIPDTEKPDGWFVPAESESSLWRAT